MLRNAQNKLDNFKDKVEATGNEGGNCFNQRNNLNNQITKLIIKSNNK